MSSGLQASTGELASDGAVDALPVIHAVTTDAIVGREDFLGLAATIAGALGPRGAIHLRTNILPARRLYDLATELISYQRVTGTWLIINDRLDVALAAGARGLQLTTRSLATDDARRAMAALPRHVVRPAIGASVHTVEDARQAIAPSQDGAADLLPAWLVAGHVNATPSHAEVPARGTSFLSEIASVTPRPVIAIGGVRPADVAGLLAAGAYGVAAIRGIWHAVDAERAVADYLSAYDAARHVRAGGHGEAGHRS